MRFKLAIFSILAFVLTMLSGCVYQNNKSALPETCSIKLTVKVKKNKLSNPDLAFKEYDYVKFWFFNDTKKVMSVLATKLPENDSKFDGEYVFFTQKWKGANTKIEVKTDVDADLTEEAIENYQIDGVPVDTKYIAIGIPDPDNGDSIEVQFIKMNSGELVVSDNSEKYGWQYEGLGIKWQTNLEKGKLITIGDEDNPVILTTKANKTFKAQLIPQMVGKTKIGKAYVTGPFNGWNQQDAAYEMTENEDGIYEFTFEGKAPGEFIYKFGYDGSWGDADVTGDIFVDDNNGGNNSKAIVNGESSSKFLPVVSLISNKKAKGTVGAYLQPDPTVIPTHDDTWDNGGMIKVDVNTDLYITNNIDFVKLLARQKEIAGAPAASGNNYDNSAEVEIWEAKNPAIKSVNITYDGMLDLTTGNIIASSTNEFNGRLLKNEPISKFIYKKEYKSPYGDASFPNEAVKYEAAYIIEGVDIPNEAGIYQFTITAVDKYNMTAQELVYMNVVNSAPEIKKTTIKTFKLGTADDYSNLVVVTAKVADVDTDDVKSIKLDLSAIGQGIVDMLDDGAQTVSGDAKAKDSIYTYSFMAPSMIGTHTYTFPVTLTDNSDLNTSSNIEFAITEAYKADGVFYELDEKANLIKKGGSQGVPTVLFVFDGRNAEGCTTGMSIEIMGSLNSWAGGEDWKMIPVGDKVWAKVVRMEEGTYEYKYRTFGDWSNNWNQEGVKDGDNNSITVTDIYAKPTKLFVFDGRKATGCTTGMSIEVMGSLNSWAGGEDWRMTPVGDKVWIHLAHLEEGTYEYKYRTFGDWSNNWNQEGVKDGDNNSITVTEADGKLAELFVFDGRNAANCTADMSLEIMGSLNSWAGGEDWKMSVAGDRIWVGLGHLDAGTYEYKYRTFGDWSNNWNQEGVKDGDNNSIIITELTGK